MESYRTYVFKVTAVCLSILMAEQNIVHAQVEGNEIFKRKTLRPYTIFTGLDAKQEFLVLAKEYLTGIEDDPKNRNISRARAEINLRIGKLKNLPGLAPEFKNAIAAEPENNCLRPELIIDIGSHKIRYFNPNMPDMPDSKKHDVFYDVAEENIGRYFTKQILIRKALPLPDKHNEKENFGPALFVDLEKDTVRELNEKEHTALNNACYELVFKDQKKEPLKSGDLIYDFISKETSKKIDIYTLDDFLLKEKLWQKGYAYIADGLISHAGTYQARAYNLFIPMSAYKALTKLLDKKPFNIDISRTLIHFWQLHELTHLEDREFVFEKANISEEIAKTLLFFIKAEDALENNRLDEALEYGNKAYENFPDMAVIAELRARINTAKKDWVTAHLDYINTLVNMNYYNGTIGMDHYEIEDQVLEILRKLSPAKMEKLLLLQIELLEALAEKDPDSDEYKSNSLFPYFGALPVILRHITLTMHKKSSIGQFELGCLKRISDLAVKGKIINPLGKNDTHFIAYIYYLAGCLYNFRGDLDNAVFYLTKSNELGTFHLSSIMLNIVLAKKDTNLIYLENARDTVELIKQELSLLDETDLIKEGINIVEDDIKKKINTEKEIQSNYEKALESFGKGDYATCLNFAVIIREKCGKVQLPENFQQLLHDARFCESSKKEGLLQFGFKNYQRAESSFAKVLGKNPSDDDAREKLRQITTLVVEYERNRQELNTLQTYLNQANKLFLDAGRLKKHGERLKFVEKCQKARETLAKIPDSSDKGVLKNREEIEKNLSDLIKMPYAEKTEKEEENLFNDPAETFEPVLPDISEAEVQEPPADKKTKREAFLSKDTMNIFRKNKEIQNNMPSLLNSIKEIASGDMRNVGKVEDCKHILRKKTGRFRIIFAFVNGKGLLVLWIDKRKDWTYKNIMKRFHNVVDFENLMKSAKNVEDFEKEESLFVDDSNQVNICSQTTGQIIENARDFSIPRLIQAMMDISAEKKKERIVLFIDEDLAELGASEIKPALKGFIRSFSAIPDNNEELKMFLNNLGNLEIVKGKSNEFSGKTGTADKENIIVITKKSNLDKGCFANIDGKGIIAAINDEADLKNAYLPLSEIALFALGKYLGWQESELREIYKHIPNAIPIETLKKSDGIFENDVKNIIIHLIPDADSRTQDIAETIRIIRDILKKA